jgi:hypothetical protein
MTADFEPGSHGEAFVKAFVEKDRRERLLFEMRKHRGRFLGRFCHNALAYLDLRFVTAIKPPNSDPDQILQLLKSGGAGPICYVISTRDEIDSRFMPLDEALTAAVGFGLPSIVSCIPGKLAYLETEQVAGPPDRFLLSRSASFAH